MIGFSAFFRLLWRRALVGQASTLGLCIVGVLLPVLTIYAPDFGISSTTRVNLFPWIFAFMVGLILVGQSLAELHHTLLAWSLPNLRRNLLFPLISVGIVAAIPVTAVYRWLGGAAPWIPVFTSAIFWYSAGIVAVNGYVRGLDRPLYHYGTAILRLTVLILAVFSINRIVEFYCNYPFLSVVLTLAGTTLCFLRYHNVNIARKKSLVPIRSPEQEVIARRRSPVRGLPLTGPITGVSDWIRAGAYENFGSNWGGWVGGSAKYSGIAVLIVIVLPYLKEVQELGILIGLHMFAPGIPAMLALGYSANGSLFLQKGWLYPLSRAQLAKLSYLSCLLYNAGICGIMLLAVFLIESFVELDHWFGFRRPLALVFVFNPVFQWMRLRHGLFFTQIPSVLVLYLSCILGVFGFGLGWFWFGLDRDISVVHEVVVCVALILLSQGLFRYKIEKYYQTSDLV
ncbi:MAG: hypothetical protein J4F39_14225 [Candidatus Latescibacteria bacterium]|nr:hypothetical protein [Candidatus Latescibacterota bacterium]